MLVLISNILLAIVIAALFWDYFYRHTSALLRFALLCFALLCFAFPSFRAHPIRDAYHTSLHTTFTNSTPSIILTGIPRFRRREVISQSCSSVERTTLEHAVYTPGESASHSPRHRRLHHSVSLGASCPAPFTFIHCAGVRDLLIYMLACPEAFLIPGLLQSHSRRPWHKAGLGSRSSSKTTRHKRCG